MLSETMDCDQIEGYGEPVSIPHRDSCYLKQSFTTIALLPGKVSIPHRDSCYLKPQMLEKQAVCSFQSAIARKPLQNSIVCLQQQA